MRSRILRSIDKRSDCLTDQVDNPDRRVDRIRETVPDRGRRVEGVGVVLVKRKLIWRSVRRIVADTYDNRRISATAFRRVCEIHWPRDGMLVVGSWSKFQTDYRIFCWVLLKYRVRVLYPAVGVEITQYARFRRACANVDR